MADKKVGAYAPTNEVNACIDRSVANAELASVMADKKVGAYAPTNEVNACIDRSVANAELASVMAEKKGCTAASLIASC